ncbi:MAG TPA: hypothetical protein VJX30_12635, partial [Terriglobales bacterium]|nr:hypothetical protein [Terriglobales bacterium]
MTTAAAPVAIDPNSFDEHALQALAVLLMHKQDTQWMTAAEISKELRDQHGIGLHWKKIESAFEGNPSAVARRKESKQWHFRILRAGE